MPEMISVIFPSWGLCPPLLHDGYTLVSVISSRRTDYLPELISVKG